MEEEQDKKLSAKEKAKKFRQEAYQKAKAYQKAQKLAAKDKPLSPEQQARKDQIKEKAKEQRRTLYLKAKEQKNLSKKEKQKTETVETKERQPTPLDFGKLKLVTFDEEKQIFKPASQPPKLTLIRCETE